MFIIIFCITCLNHSEKEREKWNVFQIGGNPRQRISVQAIEKQLLIAFLENPAASGAELRQVLIEQGE